MTQPTIGFIGLGIMGRPMAEHLLAGGPSSHCPRRRGRAGQRLRPARRGAAASPAEAAAQRSDVIITMLPDSPDVEAVALRARRA